MSIVNRKITTVDNNKSFYFSASSFKAKGQPTKKARANFEVMKPTQQCNNVGVVVEEYKNDPTVDYSSDPIAEKYIEKLTNKNECYICGQRIDKNKVNPGQGPLGSECEHILTASTIAMLTGLAGNPTHTAKNQIGDIYCIKIEEMFSILKKNSLQGDKYDELLNEYKKFRGELFPYLYDWAHPACNRLKCALPFLKIDFTLDGPVIADVKDTSSNIEFVLQAILTGKHPNTQKVHTECMEWKQTHVDGNPSFGDVDTFAEARIAIIEERLQNLKDKLMKTDIQKRNMF